MVRSLAAELGAEALPVGHERSRGILGRLVFGHYGVVTCLARSELLTGHDQPVTCVVISAELGLVLSGAKGR